MSIVCNIQNLNLNFGHKSLFKDAKITISEGDHIGLIGLNGHGKSTFFKILADEVVPDISEPPFLFDKNKTLFNLFYIPQELNIEDYKDLTIGNFYLSFYPELYDTHKKLEVVQAKLMEDYSDEKLMNQQQDLMEKFENLDGWNIESSYVSYLSNFELTDTDRSIEKLSGGEQRKMALCIGLSTNANIILWDEPTNHLDVETIEKFEDELQGSNKTFLIISHDRYLLNHVTNRIVHIESGQINSYDGTYLGYLEYLEEREKELAKNLDKLQNKHRRELAWMRQGVKARGTRSKKRVEGYHNVKSDIQTLKDRSRRVVDLSLIHSGRKSKQLIKIEDGAFSYKEKEIFKDLNLLLSQRDKIALIGPNGAGKTTLLNIISQKLEVTSGVFKALDGIKAITFDQKRESLDLEKTPFQIVGDGQDYVHLGDGTQKHVVAYLENFLFQRDQINQPISTLSGGEKNRLQLALFMKHSADLWIFDEPTNDLDIETIELLERELKAYKAPVIIVGHDRAFLDNVCDTTWLVHDKTIEIFEGGYSQVAPYLQALELEKKMKNQTPPAKVEVAVEPPVSKDTNIMNYNEKKRWKVIESDIEKQEALVEKIKAELAAFDFSSASAELNSKYEKQNKIFSQEEAKLEELMTEWEDLSAKA
jgi:ATP-binding cassette subfamily F protein uup